MAKEVTVTLSEEQLATLKVALGAADQLCTSVISGRSQGQMTLALNVARALSDIKKHRVLP